MTRTTRAELDWLVRRINALDPGRDYAVQYAYGRPRLMRDEGSVDVSPRLPAGELARWMQAYIAGIEAARGVVA